MATMTPEQCHAFMMQGTRTLKVATVRKDGRPHVAPVWFVLDGDDVIFHTALDGVKGRNMQRDPRVFLLVEDEMPPFSYVVLEGTVSFDPDMDAQRHWNRPISARYMSPERVEATIARNTHEGGVVVRVTVSHLHGEANITD